MNKDIGRLLILALIVLIGVAFCTNRDAEAARNAGFPIDLRVTASGKPGSVKVGDIVTIKIKLVNLNPTAIPKVEVAFPRKFGIIKPDQKLQYVTDIAISRVTNLRKEPRELNFKVKTAAPDGATGSGLWCFIVSAGPTQLKGPPEWITSEEICYGVTVP